MFEISEKNTELERKPGSYPVLNPTKANPSDSECRRAEFGAIRTGDPASPEAQALVRKLQDFISEHYYTCTDQILSGLGQMYAAGSEMTRNIDNYGGEGTAAFAGQAIGTYCDRQ